MGDKIYIELPHNPKSNYSIVRLGGGNVFAGNVVCRNENEVVMKNVRQLWFWDGTADLDDIANYGVRDPENCKFSHPFSQVKLTRLLRIYPATEHATESIMAVPPVAEDAASGLVFDQELGRVTKKLEEVS